MFSGPSGHAHTINYGGGIGLGGGGGGGGSHGGGGGAGVGGGGVAGLQDCDGYDFTKCENAARWRGLFTPSLKKVLEQVHPRVTAKEDALLYVEKLCLEGLRIGKEVFIHHEAIVGYYNSGALLHHKVGAILVGELD